MNGKEPFSVLIRIDNVVIHIFDFSFLTANKGKDPSYDLIFLFIYGGSMSTLIDADYTDLDQMFSHVTALDHDILALESSAVIIKQNGIDPTSHAILLTTGLLSGTALETIATESLMFHRPEDPETEIALESLMHQAREKSAHWATKILEFVKHAAHKFSDLLAHLWDKLTDKMKKISEVVWDKTKSMGRTIKAHPIKSILVAVGIAASVATVIAYSRPSSVYAGETQLHDAYDKIKQGFVSIATKFGRKVVTDAHGPHVHELVYDALSGTHKVEGTVDSLGVTPGALRVVFEKMKSIYTSLKETIVTYGGHAAQLARFQINRIGRGVKDMSVDPRHVATKLVGMINIGIKTILEVFKAVYDLMTAVFGVMLSGR